jgi:hypothetical protein
VLHVNIVFIGAPFRVIEFTAVSEVLTASIIRTFAQGELQPRTQPSSNVNVGLRYNHRVNLGLFVIPFVLPQRRFEPDVCVRRT